jgi:hypothetical protein
MMLNLGLESSEGRNDSNEQVANQLLVSFGSWDTSTFVVTTIPMTVCSFPNSGSAPAAYEEEENACVEWEGQEVQLTAKDLDYNSVGSGRTYAASSVRRQAPDMASSL